MAKIFDYFKNEIKKIKKGDVEPINISFFNKHKFTMMWIVAFCFIYISTKYANLLEKEEILEFTKSDKKMQAGKMSFVLLKRIGKSMVDTTVKEEEVKAAIREIYFSEEDMME